MDKIPTKIRQTRDDLARTIGYDLQRLFNCVRERESEAAAGGVKFVSPAPRDPETADSLNAEPSKQKRQP
jgi:hypothetical protein